MAKAKLPYPPGGEWTFEQIDAYYNEFARVAEQYKLDIYDIQLEVITADQMLDAYASIGIPFNYNHWSFGKMHFEQDRAYKAGKMGLAYELVINSDPCICYLMEGNTLAMQALVIAHAAFGHNSFFKGNYLFRQHTHADAIVEYFRFARDHISKLEEQHGTGRIERLLDAAHALQPFGIDRYRRPAKPNVEEERRRMSEREKFLKDTHNSLTARSELLQRREHQEQARRGKVKGEIEPQENLLYFLEKEAPNLEDWEREVIRIVRKVGQYFYPQRQTKIMNEGWATFWHYTLINHLYDEGLLESGFMFEFLQSHTNVIQQPSHDDPRYRGGFNPYALGFDIFRDIRRMAEEPTDEDREWFPSIAGKNWRDAVQAAMEGYKDESFVRQYLSPGLIRKYRMFSVMFSDMDDSNVVVQNIHNEDGYRNIRNELADMYDRSLQDPDLQIVKADMRGDRTLTLRHTHYRGRELHLKTAEKTLGYLRGLWGFPVVLTGRPADKEDYDAYYKMDVDENGDSIILHLD